MTEVAEALVHQIREKMTYHHLYMSLNIDSVPSHDTVLSVEEYVIKTYTSATTFLKFKKKYSRPLLKALCLEARGSYNSGAEYMKGDDGSYIYWLM